MNPETNDDINDEDMGLSEKELEELIHEIDMLRNNEELGARMVIPPNHDGHSYFPRVAYIILPPPTIPHPFEILDSSDAPLEADFDWTIDTAYIQSILDFE